MVNFELQEDIQLMCLKADSFPDGIRAAQEKLTSLLKLESRRNHFGVSYLYDDKILYMAGVEIVNDREVVPADCETYTLRKGRYISTYISDFAKDITRIDKAFKTLLEDPRIDENGCCAECYLPEGTNFLTAKDIRCMVRLADS